MIGDIAPIVVDAALEPVYRARAGARYANIRASNVGNGLVFIDHPAQNVVLEDTVVDGAYRVIENTAPQGERADVVGLRVSRVTARGVRRGFARIRYGSRDGLIEDVAAEGVVSRGKTDLPVGIAFDGQARDFRLDRCVMRGFVWRRDDKRYWNGDGFSSERGNRRLLFRKCEAHDNSDGGFDLKSSDTVLDDCVATGNARNYRFWSPVRSTRLTSRHPRKAGGIGDTTHIALYGPKPASGVAREPFTVEIDHLVARSGQGWPLFIVYHGPVRIVVGSHDIAVPSGTPLVRTSDGGSVPGGIVFRSGRPAV